MAASNGDVVNPPETERRSQPQIQRVASADFKRPHLDFLEDTMEARLSYLELCVPLYQYALEGNWDKAKPMIANNRRLLNAAIAKGWSTALHVAAGAGRLEFVKELVKLMNESNIDLDLQDSMGNTAFSSAAIAGNMEIAKFLLEENQFLPNIRSRTGFTPLLLAALQGKADMAEYLFPLTYHDSFEEAYWDKLFLTCIDSGVYDLALRMLKMDVWPRLAFAMDKDGMTGLHIMAQKAEDLGSDSPHHQNQLRSSGTERSVVLELVLSLWVKILTGANSKSDIRKIINEPSRLLFDATKAGSFDFLSMLMKPYPDLIWELDDKGQSIIHIAVSYRHPKIFNLIHDISGSNKDIILSYKHKDDDNNILHLAAKLAPASRLHQLVFGAAFQMKLELLWFEEVKKIVLPSYVNMRNINDETPRELFTKEHAGLRKDAESWMKETAESCMILSTLIAIGVLSAAFSIPVGINDGSGTPSYLWNPAFIIFSMSDAIALTSSSASILVFLSIMVSRYVEYDFYQSLPSKLIFGLVTLFISITSMMVAFTCASFITYDHDLKLKWAPTFISVISFLPIVIFLFSQFQLFYDIIYSTCNLRSLFKPSKNMLY